MNAIQLIEAEDPKSFIKRQAQSQAFEVRSRLVSWQVDGAGRILDIKRLMPDPEGYHRPTLERFNVREYRLRHGHPPTGVVPIHDIGYWGEGSYFPSMAECDYRLANPEHPRYRNDPDDLNYRDMDEAEDPKQVFSKLPRPTPVYMKDISFEDRPDVDPEMRWVAMWTTPFMIEHRRHIRGCPAGVGREKWPAIRDLVDQTNKESGTKFHFNFQSGFTSYVKSTLEAEDPKAFLQQQVPTAYQITWVSPRGMQISRFPGTSPEDAVETLHFGYANVLKVIEVRPIGRAAYASYLKQTRMEAEDPKAALRAAAGRVRYHVVAQEATWGIDEQGNVLYYTPDPDAFPSDYQGVYPDVVKFDVAEHQKYWGDIPDGIDISDIGFWLKDGTYDAADEQYRQDIKGGGIAR